MKSMFFIFVILSLFIFVSSVSAEIRPFSMVDYDSCNGWNEADGDFLRYNDLGWYDCVCSVGSSGDYWVNCDSRDTCHSDCCPGHSYCPGDSSSEIVCAYSVKYECYNNDRVIRKTCSNGDYDSSVYKWCANGCKQGETNCEVADTTPPPSNNFEFKVISTKPVEVEVDDWITILTTFHVDVTGRYLVEASIEKIGSLTWFQVSQNICDPDEQWYANQYIDVNTVGDNSIEFKVRAPSSGKYKAHVALVAKCGGDVITQYNDNNIITVKDSEIDGLKFKTISVSPNKVGVNEEITVTGTYESTKAGNYLVEAGIGKVGILSVFNVNQNTCDPDEQWYANKNIDVGIGTGTITFKVKAPTSGIYNAHVAVVTECGGTVLNQLNSAESITVGTAGENDIDINKILLYGAIAIVGFFILKKLWGK